MRLHASGSADWKNVNRKLGVTRVVDLSPLRSSYEALGMPKARSSLDNERFFLMDAIESGIVKLPARPSRRNIPVGHADVPQHWDTSGNDMAKKGRGKAAVLDR